MNPKLRTLVAALSLIYAGQEQVYAQNFVPESPHSGTTTSTPSTIMPAGKIYINLATMPEKTFGLTDQRFTWCEGDEASTCNVRAGPLGTFPDGASRFDCRTSHYGFEDPIVWPSQPNKTHLHIFFNNDSIASNSDLDNLDQIGSSTCAGGILNRTGYWVSAMIYHCLYPAETGCTANRNGEIQISTLNLVYYKSGFDSSVNLAIVNWPSRKHRMISGNANATQLQENSHYKFNCTNEPPGNDAYIPQTDEYNAVANSGTCDMNQFVGFPGCWDGINLDMPDHKSHMSEKSFYVGCPSPSFPVAFPDISFNVHYNIAAADLDFMRLASDYPQEKAVTQTSADATHIKLANTANTGVDYYHKGLIWVSGAKRQVATYDPATNIVTLAAALPSTPAAGTTYVIQPAGGMTTHGDWSNGWDFTTIITGTGKTITQNFLDKCVRVRADCNSEFKDADPTHDRTTSPASSHRWYYMYGY